MRISDWSSDVCSSDLLWSLFLSLVLMTTSRGSENHGEASRFFMYVEIRPFESAMPSIVTAPPDSLSEVRLTPSGRVLTISSKKCTVAERLACRFRSEEHTSELQSLMRLSYAVFCLKNKK